MFKMAATGNIYLTISVIGVFSFFCVTGSMPLLDG